MAESQVTTQMRAKFTTNLRKRNSQCYSLLWRLTMHAWSCASIVSADSCLGCCEWMMTCSVSCSQYSFSLTTFSPSGKLVQIEYALNAVSAGATSLGITATDGVVIATEKKLPSILVDEATVKKIANITPNIGVVYSGMGPDFRVLIRKARKTAQAYFRLYHEHIPVAQLVRETAAVMQEFTRKCFVDSLMLRRA